MLHFTSSSPYLHNVYGTKHAWIYAYVHNFLCFLQLKLFVISSVNQWGLFLLKSQNVGNFILLFLTVEVGWILFSFIFVHQLFYPWVFFYSLLLVWVENFLHFSFLVFIHFDMLVFSLQMTKVTNILSLHSLVIYWPSPPY